MKAKKKPVIIDYCIPHSLETIKKFVEEFGDTFEDHFEFIDHGGDADIKVKTLEGTSYYITKDDVIIRGVKSEYYPCKIDIFKNTYCPTSEILSIQEQEFWEI